MHFLASGLRFHARVRKAEAEASINAFISASIAVTFGAIALLVILFFAVYRPLIRRLDADCKLVRGLLLLIPDNVSRCVPAVMQHGRSMLASSDAALL